MNIVKIKPECLQNHILLELLNKRFNRETNLAVFGDALFHVDNEIEYRRRDQETQEVKDFVVERKCSCKVGETEKGEDHHYYACKQKKPLTTTTVNKHPGMQLKFQKLTGRNRRGRSYFGIRSR